MASRLVSEGPAAASSRAAARERARRCSPALARRGGRTASPGLGWGSVALLAGVLAIGEEGCARKADLDYRVFVSEAAAGTVAVFDPAGTRPFARLRVGMLPHAMLLSPDRRSLYVVLVGSQAIAEVDVGTVRLRRTFLTAPVPERRSDGSVIRAHHDLEASRHTSCFDCHFSGPGGAKPPYVGDRPFGIALSRDGTRLLVSHVRSGDVAEIDRRSGVILRSVHMPPAGQAREAAAMALAGPDLYVMLRPTQPSRSPAVVRRLDAETLEVRGDIQVGPDPASVRALNSGRVLVSNFESDTVSEIGPDGLRARYTVAPGPLGAVELDAGRRTLVLDYYANCVSFVDLESGAVRTRKLARDGKSYANPTHGALAPDGRVWLVTSGSDGHLLSLDAGSGEVLVDVPIAGLSFDVAIAPRVGREANAETLVTEETSWMRPRHLR